MHNGRLNFRNLRLTGFLVGTVGFGRTIVFRCPMLDGVVNLRLLAAQLRGFNKALRENERKFLACDESRSVTTPPWVRLKMATPKRANLQKRSSSPSADPALGVGARMFLFYIVLPNLRQQAFASPCSCSCRASPSESNAGHLRRELAQVFSKHGTGGHASHAGRSGGALLRPQMVVPKWFRSLVALGPSTYPVGI